MGHRFHYTRYKNSFVKWNKGVEFAIYDWDLYEPRLGYVDEKQFYAVLQEEVI